MANTTTTRPLEANPNRPRGLYCYDAPAVVGEGRSWRPDLVPAILDWVAGIPRADLSLIKRMRAGMDGHFIIEMAMERRDGSGPRTITIAFDHGMFAMENGSPRVWTAERIMPYSYEMIYAAVNIGT